MTGTGNHAIARARARYLHALVVAIVSAASLLVAVSQPAAAPASRHRSLIWSGDFSGGSLRRWFWVQACPGSVRVVRNPLQIGPPAVRITVSDGDLRSSCRRLQAGPNPSAFLVSPSLFHSGSDLYIGFSVYFPRGFPVVRTPRWLQVAQIYGPPFRTRPQISFGVRGNRLVLVLLLGPDHRYTAAWGTALRRGSWHHLVLRVRFSANPRLGFVQLWHNHARQRMHRRRTMHMQTLVPWGTWDPPRGRNALYLDLYRAPGFGSVTVYENGARVGRTYSSVS
jgi:Polysaccharide lyase